MNKIVKPCPFCGGKPEVGVEFDGSNSVDEIWLKAEVWCNHCNFGREKIFKATGIGLVPFDDYTNAFDEALRRWNKRVGENDEYAEYND